jgi:hypothetical protein
MRNDLAALHVAPVVNKIRRAAEACPIDKPNGISGFVEEKKSINFPIVNGTLIATEEDTSNKPTASSRGFFSCLASATIFRNEELLPGAGCRADGRNLVSPEIFLTGVSVP